MQRVAIIGSGDLGAQLAHLAEQCAGYRPAGYYDDFAEKGSYKNGLPVLGGSEDVLQGFQAGAFDALIIGIGYKHLPVRRALFNRFAPHVPFATLVHPTVICDAGATVGAGSAVYAGCTIDAGVKIGANVLLNVGCIIAHDTTIEDHCFLSPAVSLAGFITVGHSSVVGINATLIDNLTVPPGTQIGGGTVVIKNPERSGLYVGNPARYVRGVDFLKQTDS